MGKDRDGKFLDVVGDAEIASVEEGVRLGGAEQGETAARTDAEFENVGLAGRVGDPQEVIDERVVHPDLFRQILEGDDVGGVQDRFKAGKRVALDLIQKDFAFVAGVRVAHPQPHGKPVELRFRQRVRAVMLGGVLRREDDEWPGQFERLVFDGDPFLGHRFEQTALGFGGRPVDFVGEDDVREDRTAPELEIVGLLVVDVQPDDVARQQVARELDALERTVERLRERPRERRLADPRNVLD